MSTVTLFATVPAILALVNLAKRLRLKADLALVFAVGLGVGLNIADYYLHAFGGYQAAAQGLILGLSAAGLYDTAKLVGPGQ
jgi:hypothetical protein